MHETMRTTPSLVWMSLSFELEKKYCFQFQGMQYGLAEGKSLQKLLIFCNQRRSRLLSFELKIWRSDQILQAGGGAVEVLGENILRLDEKRYYLIYCLGILPQMCLREIAPLTRPLSSSNYLQTLRQPLAFVNPAAPISSQLNKHLPLESCLERGVGMGRWCLLDRVGTVVRGAGARWVGSADLDLGCGSGCARCSCVCSSCFC